MPPLSLIQAELDGALAAAKILWGELGPVKLARVFAGVAADQARGEPWRSLGRPEDKQEALSRRQLGSAILLDRNLRKVVDSDAARDLTRRIVMDASVSFLKLNVPVFKKNKIIGMSEPGRRRYVEKIQEKFFNADADMSFNGDESLNMRVTRCRFVELLEAVGEGDMAPLFCEGDRVFFDKHQPEAILDRPETLSTGGACCDFRFLWK